MQGMPFQGPKNAETFWGPCSRTTQKARASRSAVTSLGKLMAMCLCPPQTNGLATPVRPLQAKNRKNPPSTGILPQHLHFLTHMLRMQIVGMGTGKTT